MQMQNKTCTEVGRYSLFNLQFEKIVFTDETHIIFSIKLIKT